MAFLQWRRFNFFEKEFLSETHDTLVELAKSCHITCSTSGNGFLILGDSSGLVNIVSRQHLVTSFTAYKIAVTHCCNIQIRHEVQRGAMPNSAQSSKFFTVTIGTDSEDLVPVLKIWQINQSALMNTANSTSIIQGNESIDSTQTANESTASSSPVANCIRLIKLCSSTSQLQQLGPHASVTALDVTGDSTIAVGFNDGRCLLIRGELIRERTFRMKLLEVSSSESSVTGVAFASFTRNISRPQSKGFRAFNSSVETSTKQHIILFVSTRNEICSFDLSIRDKDNKFVLDNFGCDIGGSCLKRDVKQSEAIQFVVGRNDAIYFYNIDGRGPCLAYDGQKLFLYWFRNYLVVVTVNDSIQRSNHSQNDSPSTTSTLANPYPNLVTIYDIARKFVAYSCPMPAVSQVVSEWGILYLITTDGRICIFKECDTQTKLELLFRKNQFSLAIDLAKTHTYSQDSLADMFKQYGDHLYRNGDFDGAINQYCQTLGYLEPSYVIRKFLDLQRIHNLTSYLQELHKRSLATEDHTTLLINCYVKLKDEQKLNEFLRSSDIVFDVDIAIRVLRQAGYFENAALLAKRHERYDSYFSILLEDKADSKSVLDTFHELLNGYKYDIVSLYLSKYGRLLMSDEPGKTTELLKSLCLHHMQEKVQKRETSTPDKNPEELMLDISQLALSDESDHEFKPEKYLHIFLNHSAKLIEFLEFIINESKRLTGPDDESVEVPYEISNTLLEIYMHSYKNEIKEDGLAENESKIMNFLKNESTNYDFKKAMFLCQMSNFIPGLLYLYEKTGMYKKIVAHFISRKDSVNVIEMCKEYGDREPQLWVDALQYFAEIYSGDQNENTLFVLEQIERHQLLPPLMVVEMLSKHGKVTLGVVRDYLMRWIRTEQEQIEENERLIESYREECNRIRNQIEEIREKPRVFQASKCAACTHELRLPSVHFMCGHSYDETCLESFNAENDHECPLCLPENRKILNEISMFDNVRNVNELFQQELAESSEPFDVLARYCSQGLFNPLTVVTDDGLIQTPATTDRA